MRGVATAELIVAIPMGIFAFVVLVVVGPARWSLLFSRIGRRMARIVAPVSPRLARFYEREADPAERLFRDGN